MSTQDYVVKTLLRPTINATFYSDLTGGWDGTTVALGFDSTFHSVGEEMFFDNTEASFLIVGFEPTIGTTIYRPLKFNDYTGLEEEWDDGTATSILELAIADKMASYEENVQRVDATDLASKINVVQREALINQSLTFERR